MTHVITFKGIQHHPKLRVGFIFVVFQVCQICAQIWHVQDPPPRNWLPDHTGTAEESILDGRSVQQQRNSFPSHSFDHTSNLGIIGDANSTDLIVGHSCHLSCTSCSMPDEKVWHKDSLHTPESFIQQHSTLPTDVSCMSFYCTSASKRKCSLVCCGRAVDRDKANWLRRARQFDFWKQIWLPIGARGNIESPRGRVPSLKYGLLMIVTLKCWR